MIRAASVRQREACEKERKEEEGREEEERRRKGREGRWRARMEEERVGGSEGTSVWGGLRGLPLPFGLVGDERLGRLIRRIQRQGMRYDKWVRQGGREGEGRSVLDVLSGRGEGWREGGEDEREEEEEEGGREGEGLDFWNAYLSDAEEEEEGGREGGGEGGGEGGEGPSMYDDLDDVDGEGGKEGGKESGGEGGGEEAEEDLYGDLVEEAEREGGREEKVEEMVARLVKGGGREGGRVVLPGKRVMGEEERKRVEGLYAAVVDLASTLPILS